MAARSIQAPMLPETIQTILKCISTPPMTISTELQQELYQINLEARALIEKLLLAQKSSQQNIGTQNFELLQSMIGNMNMGMNSANTNSNFNSPSKIFPPTSLGVNQNPLQAVNMNAGGYGNQNMLLHNPNTMDANKALNSLLTNNNGQQQQINRFNTYGQNINMRQGMNDPPLPQLKINSLSTLIGSIQGGDNVDQQNNYQQQQQQQQQTFSIEDEVEKCIMRLFKSPSINAPSSHSDRLGVEDFTEILARFKDSPEKKEKVKKNIQFNPFSNLFSSQGILYTCSKILDRRKHIAIQSRRNPVHNNGQFMGRFNSKRRPSQLFPRQLPQIVVSNAL